MAIRRDLLVHGALDEISDLCYDSRLPLSGTLGVGRSPTQAGIGPQLPPLTAPFVSPVLHPSSADLGPKQRYSGRKHMMETV